MNQALLQLGIDFIKRNCKDCLVIVRTEDNEYELIASSRTWAIGAAMRADDILRAVEHQEHDE